MTLHDVELPALDGRDPLGFLAGLGTLRLLSGAGPAKLAWKPGLGSAVLRSPHASLDDVAAALVSIAEARHDDELLPGLPTALIPRKVGKKGSDPARIDLERFREIVTAPEFDAAMPWVVALWTDLADDEGRCMRTPFNAPTGQQTLRSMFERSAAPIRKSPERWLSEALRSWRRQAEFTGENLDSRAFRDTAEVMDPALTSYGVPGATWLALNALPFFRMAGEGVLSTSASRVRPQAATVGWAQMRIGARTRSVFFWPLWDVPLDTDAVGCLLDHPTVRAAALRPDNPPRGDGAELDSRLWALGVWATVRCARRQGEAGKSQGVLTRESVRYTA